MNVSETSVNVSKKFQTFKEILQRNKVNLINLSLTEILINIIPYVSSEILNEVFLEFLIKLSEAFYWKSCFLLNTMDKISKEQINEFIQEIYEKEEIANEFIYYKTLPLERCLYEKIFLPQNFLKLNLKKELHPHKDKALILKGILFILSKEKRRKEFFLSLFPYSIKYYLERTKEYLRKKTIFSFKELVNEEVKINKKDNFLEIIYYFLAILFLHFEKVCNIIQNNENEDIIIILKNNQSKNEEKLRKIK